MQRLVVLFLLLVCVAAIPKENLDSAGCSCNARAFRGFKQAKCSCEQETSIFDMIGIGNLVSVQAKAKLQAPPTNSSCECEVAKTKGFKGTACSCDATYVPCPVHTAGHPYCWPEMGYQGIVTWKDSIGDYVVTDQLTKLEIPEVVRVDCGPNGRNWPECDCNNGLAGSFQWDSHTNSYRNNCTVVACPAFATGAPNCSCSVGFKAITALTFDQNSETWLGTCSKVHCPDRTISNSHPKCICKLGYFGSSEFIFSTNEYRDNCTRAVCPIHASHSEADPDVCVCDKGYRDADLDPVEFDFASQSWTGSCPKVECPQHAEGHPDCKCKIGYVGLIHWSEVEGFVGVCEKVSCPQHAGGDDCACYRGHISSPSKPSWDPLTSSWTHSCQPTSCPIGSSGTDVTNCKCDLPGYVGNPPLHWTGLSWGTCKTVNCPPFSALVPNAPQRSCKCVVGYQGQVSWNSTISTWMTTCTLAPCPPNAVCNAVTQSARCATGYAGYVKWNDELQQWVSSCKRVDCPPGSLNHPKCKCGTGFSGGYVSKDGELIWYDDPVDATLSKYKGVCLASTSETKTLVACQGTTMNLQCDESAKIVIKSANFGRKSSSECVAQDGANLDEQRCLSASSLAVAQNKCDGQSTCDILASSVLFGTDCDSVASSYLEVTFECQGIVHSVCDETCSAVQCPPFSEKNADGSCTCSFGYTGKIDWVRPNFVGQCVPATCPPNATGPSPNCNCPRGYLPSPDFNFFSGSWNGACEYVPCGPHAEGWPDCVCSKGYWFENGIPISWSENGWKGTCNAASCPANAAIPGECSCQKGYLTMNGTTAHDATVWDDANGNWLHTCQKVECPEGSDPNSHPDCACAPGYSGYPTWKGQWSNCEIVQCEDDRNMVATGDKMHSCKCRVGYTGQFSFSLTTQSWVGGCGIASCPPNARCESSHAECAKGYEGTVTWVQHSPTSGEWNATCTAVPCPANSGGHPHCTCKTGQAGGVLPFSNGVYGECIDVKCPAHSLKEANGHCTCLDGYIGDVNWRADLATYVGTCDLVGCVQNAVNAPVCNCDRGFKMSIDYGFSKQLGRWVGKCEPVSCPLHSVKAETECTCKDGYFGTLTWDDKAEQYQGICTQAQCPPNSGGVNCTCYSGYSGIAYFNGTAWTSECRKEKCPELTLETDLEFGKSCDCIIPYNGDPKWVGTEWQSNCVEVSCPTHSIRDPSLKFCNCERGYRGRPEWNSKSMSYDGTCELIACPAPSIGNGGVSGCECPAGFTGDCVLDDEDQEFDCSCNRLECPTNAYIPEGTNLCTCQKGYAGKLTWDEPSNSYVGECVRIDCLENVANSTGHPDCHCMTGFAGTVDWDDVLDKYAGKCQFTACPAFSTKHPNCIPLDGYRYTNNVQITWDAELQQWHGTAEEIPCPQHAVGAPNCQCEKGYFPNGMKLRGYSYEGSCDVQPCNDDHPGFPDCKCAVGYSGQFTWDFVRASWNSTCELAKCPEHSSNQPVCECDDGYKGETKWNETNQSWTHYCERVECPTNANNHPACTCSSGYVGTITWSRETRRYLGTCTLVPCPAESRRRYDINSDVVEYLKTSNLTTSGVYKVKNTNGDFDAYFEVNSKSNEIWIKVAQWVLSYTPSVDNFGLIATSSQRVGKLSDAQINFLSDLSGNKLYRISWDLNQHDPLDSKSLFIRTSLPHDDTKPSFGIISPETTAILSSTTPTANDVWSSYTSIRFDSFAATPAMAGDNCYRLRMGSKTVFDCSSNPGSRCFTAGSSCYGEEFPILRNIQIFVKLQKQLLVHPSFDAANLVATQQSGSQSGEIITSTIPGCACYVGCYGGYDFIKGAYEGECKCSKCPENGDCSALENNPKLLNTTYPCKKGYVGSVFFDGNAWIDRCTKVSCPIESTGHPDCECAIGYRGKVNYTSTWNSQSLQQEAEYTELCDFVPCPNSAMSRSTDGQGGIICTCPTGYSGVATWNSTLQSFTGATTCPAVSCPDPTMTKSEDLQTCTCPVNFVGKAHWVTLRQKYEGDSSCVQLSTCPPGVVCDNVATTRSCQQYFSGSFNWDFETQSWNNTCSLVPCPENSRSKSASVSGCVCFTGYTPAATWVAQTQSYKGCEKLAPCPLNADLTAINETTKAHLCTCAPGFIGRTTWSEAKAAFTHSCTMLQCPEGAIRRGAQALCDCDIGYGGYLSWSVTMQDYLGSCQVAYCPSEHGADCTFSTDADNRDDISSLPCKEGYYGGANWNYTAREWINNCRVRDCPQNTVRTVHPKCECRWGYSGSVSWDMPNQNYNSSCALVPCQDPTSRTQDGHCVCPYGTENGVVRFTAGDTYQVQCSHIAPCLDHSTVSKGDCNCDKGYSGSVTTLSSVQTSDVDETSIVEQSTTRLGGCSKVSCPADTDASTFPECTCLSGFAGNSTWTTEQVWSTTCKLVTCPAHASGAPDCKCNKGYLGTLTFNMRTQQWDGECTLASCPLNAYAGMNNGVPTCKCKNGYSGTQKWDNGWVHKCIDVPCPPLSTKVTSQTTVDYQILPRFVGCHDGSKSLGLIGSPSLIIPSLVACVDAADCVGQGKQACQQIIDDGGECWGFAVSVTNQVKLYTSLASDYSRCDPDNGLLSNPDFTTYRRKSATGDCRCVEGHGGAFIFSGSTYVGSCTLDICPAHSTCSTSVVCDQGYRGASNITWDFDAEHWVGECKPIGCGSYDDQDTFPFCACDVGYRGGKHGWDFKAEMWTGACTKVDCVANSDKNFPYCRCGTGFIRNDDVPNRIISWNGDQWEQTCKEVTCPELSSRVAGGNCACNTGYKGIITFKAETAEFVVSQGSQDMLSCQRVSCPPNSIETLHVNDDGTITPICHCKEGYAGDLTWNPEIFEWGVCTLVDCPAHSSGHPNCMCDEGRSGTIKWIGTGYSGSCEAISSTPSWTDVPLASFGVASCHRVQGSDSSFVTPSNEGLDFTFGGSSEVTQLLRCDVKLPSEFTKIEGSYTVTSHIGTVQNNHLTMGWNSTLLTPSTRFIGVGTPYNVVDPGMSALGDAVEFTGSRIVKIPSASVTQTDTLRFEIQQAPGAQLTLSDFHFSTYNIPTDIVKCVRTTQ